MDRTQTDRKSPLVVPAVGGWTPDDDEVGDLDADPDAPGADEASADRDREVVAPSPGHRARRSRYSPHQPWGRLARRWVPEPLRDSRVDPGKRGALLLMVVAAIAALVAAVGVWRDQPVPRPVQSVALSPVLDSSAAGTARRTSRIAGSFSTPPAAVVGRTDDVGPIAPTATGVIVVSVTGAVRRPGLVRLTTGARVADAIDKAGGTTSAANLTGLNLAARLTDGASVVVAAAGATGAASGATGSFTSAGGEGESGGSGPTSTGGPTAKVDLNTTDVAGLDALPGVGPVTAAGIVAWREKNGRFDSVEQLQEIPGIGPAKFAALAPLVTL